MSMDFDNELELLIDAWCERRQLTLLSVVLRTYPRVSGLTDEWAELVSALKTIRLQHSGLLAPGELDKIVALQHCGEAMVHR